MGRPLALPGSCLFAVLLGSACWDPNYCCVHGTAVSPDGTYRTEKEGKEIEMAPFVDAVAATASGDFEWVQVGESTPLSVAIDPIPDEDVQAYETCEFVGVGVPAHLVLTSDDGRIDQGSTGTVAFSPDGSWKESQDDRYWPNASMQLDTTLDAVRSVLPESVLPNAAEQLWLEFELTLSSYEPLQGTVHLRLAAWSREGMVDRITLGLGSFGGGG